MNSRFFEQQTDEKQIDSLSILEAKSDQRFQSLLANLFIAINDYLALDNPEPAQPTLLNRFYKFMRWGEEGRQRARIYGSNLLENKTESELVKKVVSDYLSDQSALGSSTHLRNRIGEALCIHFKIKNWEIEKKQKELLIKNIRVAVPLGGVPLPSLELAVQQLIEEKYYAPKQMQKMRKNESP